MAKNAMGKTRPSEDPYLVFENGDWQWKVLKSWQANNGKPFARWFCEVSSPIVRAGELGDTYVSDVLSYGTLTYADPKVFGDITLADVARSGFVGVA